MGVPVLVELNWGNIHDFYTFKAAMKKLPYHFKMNEYQAEKNGHDTLVEKGLVTIS